MFRIDYLQVLLRHLIYNKRKIPIPFDLNQSKGNPVTLDFNVTLMYNVTLNLDLHRPRF